MTSQTKDRVAFGQSLSVNVAQMAAAVNTIANGGVRVSPSLIAGSAVTDDGTTVGTDVATRTRVVSKKAARADREDDGEGRRPRGRRRAGARRSRATSSPARPAPPSACRPTAACYDGSTTVSFGGFAPADDARFTVYVVIHAPEGRRGRRLDQRPGVLPDHGLRPGPLRRGADRRQAVASPCRVVSRYAPSVDHPVDQPAEATSATRPPSCPRRRPPRTSPRGSRP